MNVCGVYIMAKAGFFLDVPEPEDTGSAEMRSTSALPQGLPGGREPVMASLTPMFPQYSAPLPAAPELAAAPEPIAAAPVSGLSIELSADSWVQVLDADSQTLESALLRSGSSRSFPVNAGLRVKLGNAEGVKLRLNGEPIDVAAYQRDNVAHFRLSPDGALARVNPG